MATKILYKKNDQILTLVLTDQLTGDPLVGMTVTATLYDSTGAAVTGLTALSIVSTLTPGTYRGQIDESFDPPVGTYILKVTGGVADSNDFEIEQKVKVKVRTS